MDDGKVEVDLPSDVVDAADAVGDMTGRTGEQVLDYWIRLGRAYEQRKRHTVKKALIVVDVQNDFAHPDGSLALDGAEDAIQNVNDLVCRNDWEMVIYTMDWHPEETTHFAEHGGSWPAHCVEKTWGAHFHDDLIIKKDSHVVLKGTEPAEDGYSGFFVERDGEHIQTELEQLLTQKNIEEVHICGLAYDVCVKATALDAAKFGFDTIVHVEATAAVQTDTALMAAGEMLDAGVELL